MAGPTTTSLDEKLEKLTSEVHRIAVSVAEIRTEVRLLFSFVKWSGGVLGTVITGGIVWIYAIDSRTTRDARQQDDRLAKILAAMEKPGRAVATDEAPNVSIPDLRKAIHEEIQGAIKALPKPEP